jgi:hypothetical protein
VVSSRMKPRPWAAIGTSVNTQKSAAALAPAESHELPVAQRPGGAANGAGICWSGNRDR